MEYLVIVVAVVVSIGIRLLSWKACCPAKLPPGSMGVPVIGQTVGFLRAVHADRGERWIQERVGRYGPVSKLSLFGTPTVLLAGPAANKLTFFSTSLQALSHPRPLRHVTGEKSILNLHGGDHLRIRRALLEFLKPDMLKLYVARMDAEVRRHLQEKWAGRTTVTVLPLMKRLTFDTIAALLFDLEAGAMRDALADDFTGVMELLMAIPVNLPCTTFSRGLKASARARRRLHGITREKAAEIAQGCTNEDLISRLLSMRDEHGGRLLTDEDIVDNSMTALIGGHDTTSVLTTFMVRHLANDPGTLAAMVQEHEEIARNKAHGEALTWEDLSKMSFTWRVAQEILRIVPPVFGSMRRALEDIEFDGYRIPKGWQVFWAASATHMDPSLFHEPAKFNPSRSPPQPCSFVPFGAGPRVCPGMEFAKIQTLVAMHNLVRHFRWNLCLNDNTFVRDPFPSPLQGLPIQLQQYRDLSFNANINPL
ncbi:unnamed protein product [Alopecurus aequalis]